DEVQRMLSDGVISDNESDRLESIRDRLGLTDQQAAEIMRLIKRRQGAVRCPQCGHQINDGGRP
ncbi:MAG: hypothetical protein ACREME_13150, partial [Gemmatimonadales bacterium]